MPRSGLRGSSGSGNGVFRIPAPPPPPADPCAHNHHCVVPKLPDIKPDFKLDHEPTRWQDLPSSTPTIIGAASVDDNESIVIASPATGSSDAGLPMPQATDNAGGGSGNNGPPKTVQDFPGDDDSSPLHLALGHNAGSMDIEIAGKTFTVTNEHMLEDFAKEIGAITYRDPMFKDLMTLPKEELGPRLIDRVAAKNGRISFNLRNVNSASILQGEENGYTAYELRHICGNPALRAITSFLNGVAPC
jgi:hypothetical protein